MSTNSSIFFTFTIVEKIFHKKSFPQIAKSVEKEKRDDVSSRLVIHRRVELRTP